MRYYALKQQLLLQGLQGADIVWWKGCIVRVCRLLPGQDVARGLSLMWTPEKISAWTVCLLTSRLLQSSQATTRIMQCMMQQRIWIMSSDVHVHAAASLQRGCFLAPLLVLAVMVE